MNKSVFCQSVLLLLVCGTAAADGLSTGKIYHPYVQPLEKEFELHAHYLQDDDSFGDDRYRYKLGYGQALNDRWFAEVYITGEGESGSGSDIKGYEAELKYQLTEQGEYSADWGLLLELEREPDDDVWESSLTLIGQKDYARYSFIGNLGVVYESGDALEEEFETEFAGMMRYRYQRYFEPGIEVFVSEDTKALGPSCYGELRIVGPRKLLWQVALLGGVNSGTPDIILKLNLEFEF